MLPTRLCYLLLALIMTGCASQSPSSDNQAMNPTPIPIKMVVVTMFEVGDDTGDDPGEFQTWKERQGLDVRFPFPQSYHDLYLNPETGVLGMVTGMGTNRASSAIMALGLDPRFDLTKAYWLVAGIAGFDPADASIGSVAWAEWAVDGDLAHEIDTREMPNDWTTGYFPLFTKEPYPETMPPNLGEVFELNRPLTQWAFSLTKDIELTDDEHISETREVYDNYPEAQRKPFVLIGDNLAAMTFWHGEVLNDWANQWVDYWTQGEGKFVSSAMEDTATAQSLTYLDRAGKVDYDRFMILRAASNFTLPPPGLTAAENLALEGEDYAGLHVALENAYRVGSRVVDEIINNWDTYKDSPPAAE